MMHIKIKPKKRAIATYTYSSFLYSPEVKNFFTAVNTTLSVIKAIYSVKQETLAQSLAWRGYFIVSPITLSSLGFDGRRNI